MEEIRYLISDASKKVDVETHVLRYWEEELGLSIPRNEMGHRYYTEFHIRLFRQVKQLKARGYQLKAIKMALQQVMVQNQGITQAADVLEKDMARTLQENQPLFRMQNEELPEGIMRLADYNRLESSDSGNGKLGFRKSDVSWDGEIELLDKRELNFIKEKEKTAKKEEIREKTEAEEKRMENNENIENKEKIYNKQEIKEKDGQTEMKKKGKNRKKASAWERRNGVVGKEQESITENGEKKDKPWKNELEELIAERERRMLRERNLRQQECLLAESEEQEDDFQINLNGYSGNVQVSDNGCLGNEPDWETIRENEERNNLMNKAEKRKKEMKNGEAEKGRTENNETEKGKSGKDETGTMVIKKTGLNVSESEKMEFSEAARSTDESAQDLSASPCSALPRAQEGHAAVISEQDEKMLRFQEIMNHIIGQALEQNNEKLSRQISEQVSEHLAGDLEEVIRIRDEREEERFRQLDETIRSCQRDSQGKAEAAATRIPFFRKRRPKKNRHPQSF